MPAKAAVNYAVGFFAPFFIPIFLVLSVPSHRQLWGYGTVVLLGSKSAVYHNSMIKNLDGMALSSGQYIESQAEAGKDLALSAESEEQAQVNSAEASVLHDKAALLREESAEDGALSAEEQISSEKLATQAAEEQTESVLHVTKSTADEVLFRSEIGDATEEAATAVSAEASVIEDASAIAACQAIPFADAFCAIAGAAVGAALEYESSTIGAKSATDFVAATLSKADEDKETALAADFETKSGSDVATAAEQQAKSAINEAASEAELESSLNFEKEADELEIKAKEEIAIETEKDIKGGIEEGEAEEALQKSFKYGLHALWDAGIALFASLASFVVFAYQYLNRFVLPFFGFGAKNAFSLNSFGSIQNPVGLKLSRVKLSGVGKQISHVILHIWIMVAALSIFSAKWSILQQYSVISKGGVILLCTLVATAAQLLVWHATRTNLIYVTNIVCDDIGKIVPLFLAALEESVFLISLFTAEFISAWFIFGPNIVSYSFFKSVLLIWVLLALTWCVHFYIFEVIYFIEIDSCSKIEKSREEEKLLKHELSSIQINVTAECYDNELSSDLHYGSDGTSRITQSCPSKKNYSFTSLTKNLFGSSLKSTTRYFQRMQLPFEILLMSLMVAISVKALPVILKLRSIVT